MLGHTISSTDKQSLLKDCGEMRTEELESAENLNEADEELISFCSNSQNNNNNNNNYLLKNNININNYNPAV